MINREWQTVSVVSFTAGGDPYGQRRKTQESTRQVQMAIRIYNQQNVEDIRYNEVSDIGLTWDKEISDKNQIITADGTHYDILYVIPSSRLYQVLMRKVK